MEELAGLYKYNSVVSRLLLKGKKDSKKPLKLDGITGRKWLWAPLKDFFFKWKWWRKAHEAKIRGTRSASGLILQYKCSTSPAHTVPKSFEVIVFKSISHPTLFFFPTRAEIAPRYLPSVSQLCSSYPLWAIELRLLHLLSMHTPGPCFLCCIHLSNVV